MTNALPVSQSFTLCERITEAATRTNGTVTFIDGEDHVTMSWSDLHDDARSLAAGMQANGIGPGHHVAILGPTTRSLVTAIQATWLCGACVVMLPLPMRMGSLDQFISQTRQRIADADSTVVLIDPQLAAFVEPSEEDPPFLSLADLVDAHTPAAAYVEPPADPDAMAVLQFTSGSTSDPKGVVLSNRVICNNIDGALAASQLNLDDKVVSWLPLYHDMGMIGLLSIPMTSGVHLVQAAPQDFMSRPSRWMQWLSDFGGTTTAGPNFSYVLATRALKRAEGLDLSTLKIVLSGAEPIDCEAFRSFAEAGARFGLPAASLYPAFGMAEVCIAGTFCTPGDGLLTDTVDAVMLEHERLATAVEPSHERAREMAVLGRPVPGLSMRVVDPENGRLCRDREVGELQISGNSLTSGYYRQPDATAELIVDGWLHTGDLAYMIDGRMVMCGRIKDVIIIGGRNIYPQDIEKIVGGIDGVRAGNVIAFGQTGRASKQHIVVVAETKLGPDAPERAAVLKEIARAVTDEIGVPPREVVLVPAGTVPKTSSGKLQRSACRSMFEAGGLGKVPEGSNR